MAYIGHSPSTGEDNNFKILDDISSYTLTFDGSDSSVVSTSDETIYSYNHRFVQGQRVKYTNGGGGDINGLTNNTYYFIIKHDHNNIKLATSASNATDGTAVNITAVGSGSSHTLNVAFDGVNTKFKATHTTGQKARITRGAQLVLSVNGVIQQPHDSSSPSTGFGFDLDGTIVFSQAPQSTDAFWGHILTNNNVTFDISDNTVDHFTGNGSTSSFTLSKSPPNNENILVTIDGVVQYPNDSAGNIRSYATVANVINFTNAPGTGTQIEVRHIGFAGAVTGAGGGGVTGFYGRTGNVTLVNTDNIAVNNANISGNAIVTGDLTVNGTTTTLDTNLMGVDRIEVLDASSNVAVAITQNGDGDILNLYDGSSEVFSVTDGGITRVKKGVQLIPETSNLYATDGALSYYATNNAVYLNGAGNSGRLRLNATGSNNDRTSINLCGQSVSNAQDAIIFKTATNERFRINSTGNIKVQDDVQLQFGGTAYNASSYDFQIYHSGLENHVGLTTHPLIISSTGGERMRIHNDYVVSIGNTNISSLTQPARLRIQGSYVNNIGPFGILEFKNRENSGNATASIRANRDAVAGGNYSAGLTFHTNSANPATADDGDNERMVITSTGKVGIGITNPDSYQSSSDNLVIGKTNDAAGITIRSGTNNGGYITFANAGSGSGLYKSRIAYDHQGDKLSFSTNGTPRLFILGNAATNGQIGINTATPINDFTLLTDGNGYVDFHGSGGGGAEMNVYKKQDKSLTYKFANNGGANELAQHYLTNASGKFLWYIGGTSTANEKMRLENNGRLGIGTATPQSKLELDGRFRILDNSDGTPSTGKGLEISYYTSDDKADILSYDRGASAYKDLMIRGNSIDLRRNNTSLLKVGTGGGNGTVGFSTTAVLVTNGEKIAVRGYSSFKSYNSSYAAIYVSSEGNTNDTINNLINFNAGGANRGGIGYMPNTGELRFNNQYFMTFCTGAAILGGTERLRIHADGEVDIKGGAAGQNALLVTGNYSASNNVDIQTWQRSGGAVKAKMIYKDAGTTMHFGTSSAHNFLLMTGGADRIKIADNSAATSIGGNLTFNAMLTVQGDVSGELLRLKATENTSRLMVSGTNSNGVEVNLYDEAGGQKGILGVSGTEFFIKAPNTNAPLKFYTRTSGGSVTEKVSITSAGTLQIAANGNLYVVGGGSYNASLNGNILSFDRAGYSYIDQTSNSGTLVFRVGASSANMLRLDTQNAYFPNGTLFLGTQNTSSGHINAYENMSFNIDSDNDDTNRYFSFHANGNSASGTELVRITEGGNVGVDEDDPQAKMHLRDDTNQTQTILKLRNYKSGVNTRPRLAFEASTSGNQGANSYIQGLAGTDADGANNENDSGLAFIVTHGGTGTERTVMEMTHAGDILMHRFSTLFGHAGIRIFNTLSGGPQIQVSRASGDCVLLNRNTSDGEIVEFRRGWGAGGSIEVGTNSCTYNTSSDYRLKENVVPISDGIARLKTLKPSRFNWIGDTSSTRDGFLAHEVQSVVPGAVTGTKDEVYSEDEPNKNIKSGDPKYQGIDQSRLVPLLTAALQEAVVKIETLEAKVAALEG